MFMRGSLFALCVLLVVVGRGDGDRALWLTVLALSGIAATAARSDSRYARLATVIEAAVAALAVSQTGGADSPLFAYIPAIGFAGGLAVGLQGPFLCAGTVAAVFFVQLADLPTEGMARARFTTAAAEWTILALVVGLGAVALRSVLARVASPVDERYTEAYRLLEQLRGVTRSLPGSLDPGTTANVLLERVQALAASHRGAVLIRTGDRFSPLALHGTRRLPWRLTIDEPGPVRDAWERRGAVVDRRSTDKGYGRRQGSSLLVVPLITSADRPVGLLVLESLGDLGFDAQVVADIEQVALESTPMLETAALFDELRLQAAAEERTRLAREMHDGIAQDLAFLGYEVDALTTTIERGSADDAAQKSRALRASMSSLVTDLRLSITDLKSSVGPARGIGAALSDYTRSVGSGSGITVHMSLTEATTRLGSEAEVLVLRIAHEAINAARRRPGARNLWVHLAIDPPSFRLAVEDDGDVGSSYQRDSARSAEIISDMAARLGAQVQMSPRPTEGAAVIVEMEAGGR